jgi:diadenosine tetraphosphate (Ap4A) HIT family hydrolase
MQSPSTEACAFCRRIDAVTEPMIARSEHCVAFYDGFPLNPGHALIIPKRHQEDFFALSTPERAELFALLPLVKEVIEEQYGTPDGYNIGMNIGEASGQTVGHVHLHLIPRLSDDMQVSGGEGLSARGGVRWVVPARADYWSD